jgi:hypothetical protein
MEITGQTIQWPRKRNKREKDTNTNRQNYAQKTDDSAILTHKKIGVEFVFS